MNTRLSNYAFPSAASNATSRTMQERFVDGYINVKEYGAIGNGIVDDRDAIQSAMDNGVRNNCGIVFFPPGTYRVGAPLLMPVNTHRLFRFVGCGADLASGNGSIIKASISSYILYCRHGTTAFVSIEGLGFINTGSSPPSNSEPKNSPDLYYQVSGTASGSSGTVRLFNSSMDLTYQYSFIFKDWDSVDVYGVNGTTEANGTWIVSSPNWEPASWVGISNPSQTSASAGGSGGTNYRMNYYGATGVKAGDVLILTGIVNSSDGNPHAINGNRTVTAVGLTGVWNTGWVEFSFTFSQAGQGGMVRGKWVDLRGTTYSPIHPWTGGGEFHYNGYASGCIYNGAGVGTSVRNCSFQIDKGICLFYQNINGYVGCCHFKGGFNAADVYNITSTTSGTNGYVRLMIASTTGLAVGNRVFVYGVSPSSNEANGDYYVITAIGSGYVEIGVTYSSSGTGGRLALFGSVGFFTGGYVESCTFENLTVGAMGGFNGPGILDIRDSVFKKCGYCVCLGTILLPWWNSNVWQIEVAGGWVITNCYVQTVTMESFAIGGLMTGNGGANTIEGLKIVSDGSLGIPQYGMGGPGGQSNIYRNVTISGTYSGAALDNFNMHSAIFDGIDVSNSGPGVTYRQPWQGANAFRNNNIGFNPAKPFSALPAGGDVAPFKYMKVTVSDSVDLPYNIAGGSTIGKPISGGGSNLVEARWNGSQWVMAG